jgi:hypothetical protein
MLLYQDVSSYDNSSFTHLYEKEWATLYRLTISTSEVNSETEQYWKDFAIFLSHDLATRNFLLPSLMG